MVLAVAALLMQFQSFAPPAQPTYAHTLMAAEVAVNFSKESAPVSPNPLVKQDDITETTESSSIHINLDEVHLVNENSKTQFAGNLQTIALETPEDTQSFSTVRIAEPPTKEHSVKEALALPSRRAWLALALMQHGAAAFDAYSTRQAVGHGATEDNPLLRPFPGSPAIYVATQVAPVLFDLVARHMQRSEYPLVRRLWWMPQTMSTGLSIFSGVHNLHVASRP